MRQEKPLKVHKCQNGVPCQTRNQRLPTAMNIPAKASAYVTIDMLKAWSVANPACWKKYVEYALNVEPLRTCVM